jgi:hypothetical protein
MTAYVQPVGIGDVYSNACYGKHAYATLADATLVAENTTSNRNGPNNQVRPYQCPDCGRYHIGHSAQEVADGLATHEEWYQEGAGKAVRQARFDIVHSVGLAPTWSRVGQAWRATVVHPIHGPVSSKPSADPGLAAENLLARLRRLPRVKVA